MQKYWNTVQDERGNPRYGASVSVQQNGVNSSIYTDSAGLIPAANPLTTDSTRGYFEFYAAAGTYDLSVFGVGFSPYTITGGAILGLPSGDVTFTQSGTGAVATTVSAELGRLSVSPEQFGCLGDGTTNDSTNMQKAATAAAGGRLTLTPGKTYLAANVSIPANTDVDTRQATLKLPVLAANTGSPILTAGGNNINIYGGGTFDGNKANQTADGFSDSYNGGANGTGRAYRAAITASSRTDIKVSGCHFKNTYGAGVATQNCDRVSVFNNTSADTNFEIAYCSTTVGGHADYLIQGNRGYNFVSGDGTVNANACLVAQANRINISNNIWSNCERSFAKSEGGNDITINNNTVDTNTVNNFPAFTIQQNAANVFTINGNIAKNVGAGILLTAPTLTSGSCVGNTIDTTTGTSAADGIQVSNATSCSDVEIGPNILRNIKRIGVYAATTASRLKIFGNIMYGQGIANQQAIILGGTGVSDAVSIENNTMANFSADAVNDGVVSNSAISGGTYTNFVFRGNTVLSGSSTNRAVFFNYSASSITGVFENNNIDGTVTGTQVGLRNGLNTVTGTNTLGAVTFGTFTCAANKDTTVTNTAVTAASLIYLQATNAAAGTLMGAATALYISARTAATSFKVTTANAGAAGGTETFNYWIIG